MDILPHYSNDTSDNTSDTLDEFFNLSVGLLIDGIRAIAKESPK